jgi:purine nucleosidase
MGLAESNRMGNPSPPLSSLIIDTDAGVDDAIAIMMALKHPNTQVVGITTVNGNVNVDQVTDNVCLILDQVNGEVPVYKGCHRPLFAAQSSAESIHGSDGLGDVSVKYLPTQRKPEMEHAALALIRFAREHAGNFTLLTLGPLTNLALAIRIDPNIVDNIPRLVVMGGAVEGRGNATPSAEFNIFADPEAAAIVFEAGFSEIWLLSWETTLKYPLFWEQYERLVSHAAPIGEFFRDISAFTAQALREGFGAPGFLLPDPLAAAVALAPEIVFEAPYLPVSVVTNGKQARGMTSVDWVNQTGEPANVHVVTALNDASVFDMLGSALR